MLHGLRATLYDTNLALSQLQRWLRNPSEVDGQKVPRVRLLLSRQQCSHSSSGSGSPSMGMSTHRVPVHGLSLGPRGAMGRSTHIFEVAGSSHRCPSTTPDRLTRYEGEHPYGTPMEDHPDRLVFQEGEHPYRLSWPYLRLLSTVMSRLSRGREPTKRARLVSSFMGARTHRRARRCLVFHGGEHPY